MSTPSIPVDRRALLQNALAAVEKMQARLEAVEQAKHEPIAIIGLSCRFPGGANDPDSYWHLLHNGVDAVREVPPERWNINNIINPAPTWYGGFLEQVDGFDPQFFGLSPREVTTMDPQQRLVLEVSWEALEQAGQAPDKLKGSQTGIFVGITTNDYAQLALSGDPDQLDAYTATGGALNVAPGRVAYTLGLQGPSIAIDTACSSSLVAVHLACQSLRSGESNLALAGGVNALLRPEAFICFNRWGMMAPDGRCKTFDDHADGFVRGEGCGILVLKRLSDALAAGDNIFALIRGSAVNQDGRSSGLTVPNGLAQQAVVRTALANAQVKPAEIGYVEAHGTGTSLGDPIEVEALGAVLGEGRSAGQPLFLGSVKTNIGHLESAAGIAGLMKVVLALQHREIPPHLHLQKRSERIPWPDFPVVIPTEPTAWDAGSGPRLAGVSAFGFSGTNAHVVLEEAPCVEPEPLPVERSVHLLTLSAKSEPALKEAAAKFARQINTQPNTSPANIGYTANTGRAHFQHRLAVLAESSGEMGEKLAAFAAGQETAGLFSGQVQSAHSSNVVFLFTGQGSQYVGMGRQLYETQPTFRQALDRCDELLRPYLDQPLLSIIYPDLNPRSQFTIHNSPFTIDQTSYTQPALFALEYALAELWQSWGVKPAAVMGHSVGEYVAACVAGVFSLEDGLKLIATRGGLMGALPAGGEMAAVFTGQARVEAAIAPYAAQVSIAAVNGPENVVISGAGGAVQAILETLAAEGIKAQRLSVSHAFHSPLMEPMLDAFSQAAATVTFAAPKIDLISNVTGQVAGPEIATAVYWRQHVRAPVLFAGAIQTLQQQGHHLFLEIGPSPTLISMGQRCCPDGGQNSLWLPSLRRNRADWPQMLPSLAALYTYGLDIDWVGFDRDYAAGRRRLSLPTYPFQRERYWLPPSERRAEPGKIGWMKEGAHPLLGSRLDLASMPGTYLWQGQLSLNRLPYLADHRVQGAAILPATAYIEMVMTAAAEVVGPGLLVLTRMDNHKMLVLADDVCPLIQVILVKDGGGEINFQVYSQSPHQPAETWTLHASGKLLVQQNDSPAPTLEPAELKNIQLRCPEEITGQAFYRQLNQKGNEWGPAFQGVERLWRGEGEALSLVRVPEALEKDIEGYGLHPAVADACGHVLAATIPLEKSSGNKGGAFVGGGVDEVRLYRPLRGKQLWAYARLRPEGEQGKNVLVGDVRVFDETGALITETLGARLWYLEHDQSPALPANLDDWFYDLQWQPAAPPEVESSAPAVPGTWLIFADNRGVGAALAGLWRTQGNRCVLVSVGGGYEQVSQDIFSLHPGRKEEMRQLFEAAFKGDAPGGIVHLWSLEAFVPEAKAGKSDLQAAQTLAGASVLHLVQEAVQGRWRETPRLWLASRGAQAVGGESTPPAVAQSLLWGLGRTLALEHSELWGGLIDLDPGAPPAEAAALLAEGIRQAGGEDQLAFRDGQRYVARLVRRQPPPAPAVPFHCRADGAYLLTGGLGGIGLEVARWLVQKGARRLILLGRTAFPPRPEWNKVEPGSRLGRKIAAVRELEALGASVHLAAVDVSDESQLCPFLEQFQAEGWPPIRGVMHAAGVMMYQPLVEHEAGAMAAILQPKVSGGWLLHRLLQDAPLDFFVMFSSNSALLSSPLMGSYAAANTFLDGLAHYRKALGRPALSINWGTWAGVGMVTEFEGTERPIELRGVGTIAPRQGLEALERLLAQKEATQVAVMPINWQQWRESYPIFQKVPLLSQLMVKTPDLLPAEEGRQRFSQETLLAADPEVRPGLLESYLSQQVARILGFSVAALSVQQPITNMGLDSLMAVELKNRIERDLKLVTPMVQILQGPSITQLAGQLLYQLAQSVISHEPVLETSAEDGGRADGPAGVMETEWEEGEL